MKKIKIFIVAHFCREGGGLVLTRNMLRALKNVTHDEQFMIICSAGCGYEEIEWPSGSEIFIYKGKHSALGRCWFEEVTLPKVVNSYNPDVIFGMANYGLPNPPSPQAVFFHQAYFLYDKKHYPHIPVSSRIKIHFQNLLVKRSLKKTALIFCQTPIIKRRFSAKYKYPENRIGILRFPPPSEEFLKIDAENPSALDTTSDNFYVLLLTRYLTHRNPHVLIPLCLRYRSQIVAEKIKFITTVEEQDHPRAAAFLREISENSLNDIIINVGRLNRVDVFRYLSGCNLLWIPTLLETLCLPFLEGMVAGISLMAPDLDFARYICGDAANYYDPWNLDSMFKCLMEMKNNKILRETLVAKGKTQLSDTTKFARSWEETAAYVLGELRNIARSN